jgi:hypothetical protein
MHLELYRLLVYCSLSQGHGRTSQRILIFFLFFVSPSPSSCSLFSASFILWFPHFLPDLPICSFLYLLNPFLLYPTVSMLLFFHLIILPIVILNGQMISSSQGLYLNTGQHKHRINIYTYKTSIHCVGCEPAIPASDRAKRVHASDRSATVTSMFFSHRSYNWKFVYD